MKKILAIVLALALTLGCVICLASCGKTNEDETTTATTEVDETTAVEATEAASEDAAEGATEATEVATEAETSTEAATEAAKAPESKEEILALYNDAINSAIEAKAGYNKTRVTNINKLDGGALLKIQIVVDTVNDFLGAGTKNYSNTKGKAEYLSKASLSAADVSNATCTEKDGKYTVEISVNGGNSSAPGSDNSAIKRTGIFVGEGDNSAYDYKSAENIHYALNHTDGASVESVRLSTSNIKITAVIDAATGHIESLKLSFNFDVSLTNVKYTIAKVAAATGNAVSTVTISDFKY